MQRAFSSGGRDRNAWADNRNPATTRRRDARKYIWEVDLLSREWIGFLFGAVGGIITGAASAAVLALPNQRYRRTAIGVFAFTGLFIGLCQRKNELLHPLLPSDEDQWASDNCLQTTDATCGPASLATCLRAIGTPAKEQELAIQSNTSMDGTLFADLARAARRHGAKAKLETGMPLSAIQLPAVAGVTLPNGIDQFIAVLSIHGRQVVADPLDGIHPMDASKNYYTWSGLYLSISSDSRVSNASRAASPGQ